LAESMPVEQRSGFTPEDAQDSLPHSGKNKGVIPMPVNVSPVRSAHKHVTEEYCSCCRDALASAAHELKTPLAIMDGYLQLLLAQRLGPLNPRQMEVLGEMQSNGARLSTFIQNLLTYAALKVDRLELNYEVGDINACISEIAEVWAQRFGDKAIAFYFLPNDKLQPFPFDYYKVQHVVSNLLDNAMKYTPASGTVWLHVEPYFWERRTVARPPMVERRRQRTNAPNCCRVSVSDTGPGIAPEFQQEIFEEYFRLVPPGMRAEGHGLGLAIARRLVQSAGGKIWVESESGAGSKFSFLILLNPPQEPLVEEQ
jgi:two-component system, NtrC family, sensor histidine kinase KinB